MIWEKQPYIHGGSITWMYSYQGSEHWQHSDVNIHLQEAPCQKIKSQLLSEIITTIKKQRVSIKCFYSIFAPSATSPLSRFPRRMYKIEYCATFLCWYIWSIITHNNLSEPSHPLFHPSPKLLVKFKKASKQGRAFLNWCRSHNPSRESNFHLKLKTFITIQNKWSFSIKTKMCTICSFFFGYNICPLQMEVFNRIDNKIPISLAVLFLLE